MSTEHKLAVTLRKMVEIYREGQDNPRAEPQCIWQAIQALKEYDAANVRRKPGQPHRIVMKEGN